MNMNTFSSGAILRLNFTNESLSIESSELIIDKGTWIRENPIFNFIHQHYQLVIQMHYLFHGVVE
jgi:hypothetical protein